MKDSILIEKISHELKEIDGNKYMELKVLTNIYLGYKCKLNFTISNIIIYENDIYVQICEVLKLIKTKYNKRNPHIVKLHNKLGLKFNDYTIEAITLEPIINYLDTKKIIHEVQHTMKGIDKN